MKKRNTGKKIAKYVVIAIILFVLLFPVYWRSTAPCFRATLS